MNGLRMAEEEIKHLPDEAKQALTAPESDEVHLDREGRWVLNGRVLTDPQSVAILNRALRDDGNGGYIITCGPHRRAIRVEDTPIFVEDAMFNGFGHFETVTLSLSNGTTELLDINTLQFKHRALYCRLAGGRPAKFKRRPMYQILDRLEESDGVFHLRLCGRVIQITNED